MITITLMEADGDTVFTAGNSLTAVETLIELFGDNELSVCEAEDGSETVSLQVNEEFSAVVEGTTINRMLDAYEHGRCMKCGGDGWIAVYSHIKQGICFRCGGVGIDPEKPQ